MEYFTREQWKILLILGGCNFMSAVVFSLQAPFYPAEAEKQGASITFAGVVLGSYELSGFIACPLISSMLLPRLGSYWGFHLGLLTTGTTTLLFGFLNRLTVTTTFVSLSILLRILEATGATTTFISSYGFLSATFPDSLATAFAVMQTMYGVGMAAGPPLGEAMYQLGRGSEAWSFTLPFLTVGLVVYTALTLTAYMLWPMRKLTNGKKDKKNSANGREESKEENEDLLFRPTEELQSGGKKEEFIAFLKIPTIFILYVAVMVGSICFGFLTCTLEPHLRQFHLTPIQTGGIFLIFGGVYAGFAPIWGMICDRIERPILVTISGCLLSIFAFTFMGPSSIFIPLQPSITLTGVSLAAFGLSMGGLYVSVFLLMINEAKRHGFPDTSTLSGAISAVWLNAMQFGCIIGPILGGALFDKFGFGVETLFLVVLSGVSLILLLFVLGLNPSSSPPGIIHQSDPEQTSLLTTTITVYVK